LALVDPDPVAKKLKSNKNGYKMTKPGLFDFDAALQPSFLALHCSQKIWNNLSFFLQGEDFQGEKAAGSLLSAGPAGRQEIQTETAPGYQGRDC
jgi:hypothetical protein